MSKRAEERALEIFPVKKVPYYGLTCNAYTEKDANLDNRALFQKGYEQAEKDLALTAEDVGCIFNLVRQMKNKYNATSACYQEVADIFNKDREEEK